MLGPSSSPMGYVVEVVRMDMSEHVRTLPSVGDEGTLVRQGQETEGGRKMSLIEHLRFVPGLLHKLSYLSLKAITVYISSEIYRQENRLQRMK